MEHTQTNSESIPDKVDREAMMNEFYRRVLEKSGRYSFDQEAVAIRSNRIRAGMADTVEAWKIRAGRQAIRIARELNRYTPEPADAKEKYMKTFSGKLVSVELECVFHSDYKVPTAENLGMMTEVVGDGSVSYQSNDGECGSGAEVKVTMRSENPVRLKSIVDKISAMGGEVNTTCGMHVHLDQRGVSKVTATKRAKRLVKALPALMKLVPESRLDNRFCRQNREIPKSGSYRFSSDRYQMINYISAYRKHKTLEVRLHGGTLDFWKVLGWIKLCQFIQNSSEIDSVAKNNDSRCLFVSIEQLIRMESLPESIRNYVWKRFRQFHMHHAISLRNKLIEENKIHLTDGMAIS